MSKPVAFAIAAHPDDIELMMAGTLLLLGQAGYELHYMNIANGSCGTATDDRDTIVKRRDAEAREAAKLMGAVFHQPLTDDLDIYYERSALARLGAIVRDVKPAIMLVQSPEDYMEDHMNACRLAVSAAFCRGLRNFTTDPVRAAISSDVTVYHALPWGLRGQLRQVIRAGQYVNIGSVLETKRAALACHKSQKEWLDVSQGLDSYLTTMEDMARTVGQQIGCFEFAEGWRRHLHLGFCAEDADPLAEALSTHIVTDPYYESALENSK
ncbi:MAG: PIG-L family deacetylase [Candidatus Hydrogenedentes bacterium]|nr:PIG-L family deacetylase [Candidatus Hydrogenedentota bacterium]